MDATLETTDTIPLKMHENGVIRVGNSRVTLDTLASAFEEGATPEEICQQYPTLQLGEVYAVIGHLLRHPKMIAAYLQKSKKMREQVKRENKARFPSRDLRARLLARRQASGK
jgi:uncharacterized protein (DUF433 family)